VIKVEAKPDGDPLRSLDPEAFERLNAGKKSVVLDLRSEEGKRAFRGLVTTADVLVEGFRPGVMARLGLDYESLRNEASRLVYLSLTGYGASGPYRDRAGHDVNYLAAAGALEGTLRPPVIQVADFAAGGLFAAVAVLSALVGRTSGAPGRHIDLSMHHGACSLMMLAEGEAASRLSGRFPNYALYRTRDGGRLSVGALEPKFWAAFCAGIGRPDLEARMLDPEALPEVARVIEAKDLAYWRERFSGIDACVEAVASPEIARAHPQALHRGVSSRFSLPFPGGGIHLGRAPRLGEHTAKVLSNLG
ncbi:MAG TPA: CaiB/BaiF CoA-transferase family protein, partial [Vicinamibacteria bacterium]|nr:CaiB/BaiF CoA-transferase family protein [Vicinamibacteria bacterium]